MQKLVLVTGAALCILLAGPIVSAHISLTSPWPETAQQKTGPCGSGGVIDGTVSVYSPGQTITVVFDEFINHTGHFRISFDDDGQDDFVDPASFTDFYSAPSVLLDNIPDAPGGGQVSVELTLPDIKCATCTLQVVQVMTDKPPYGDGNDLYYQCADIALAGPSVNADAAPESIPDAGTTTDAGGPEVGPDLAPDAAPESMPDAGTTADLAPAADSAVELATGPPPANDDGCAAAGATPPVVPALLLLLLALLLMRRPQRVSSLDSDR